MYSQSPKKLSNGSRRFTQSRKRFAADHPISD